MIDREDYDLLYVNENEESFDGSKNCVGQRYAAPKWKDSPAGSHLRIRYGDGQEHEMRVEGSDCLTCDPFKEETGMGSQRI